MGFAPEYVGGGVELGVPPPVAGPPVVALLIFKSLHISGKKLHH